MPVGFNPCCCTASTGTTNFTVVSCGASGDPSFTNLGAGITVRAFDHVGGTLLDSKVTDAFGGVVLAITTGLTYYITANTSLYSLRFADYAASTATHVGTNFLGAPAAAGYACSNVCILPLKTTLNVVITDSGVPFAETVTWTSSPAPFGSWNDVFGDFFRGAGFITNLGGAFGNSPDSVVCPTSLHIHYTFLIPGSTRTVDVTE